MSVYLSILCEDELPNGKQEPASFVGVPSGKVILLLFYRTT